MKGIEPSCAAWEAAVLPLNYTREEIFDFRFSSADCNRNLHSVGLAVPASRSSGPDAARTGVRALPLHALPSRENRLQFYRLRYRMLQNRRRINHCHEITSSEFVKDGFAGVLVPIAWSAPYDHPITPMRNA